MRKQINSKKIKPKAQFQNVKLRKLTVCLKKFNISLRTANQREKADLTYFSI